MKRTGGIDDDVAGSQHRSNGIWIVRVDAKFGPSASRGRLCGDVELPKLLDDRATE